MAALGAVIAGPVDDRIGGKPVIVASLTLMIIVGLTLLSLSGPVVFWICGLLLALCVGPVTTSARTVLLRMVSDGKEAVAFGLYTTTGRAASFLAPWLFFVFVDSAIPWCDTVIQALITRVSPVRMTTTLLGAYFLTYAAGNFLVGWLGSLYESMTPAMFWGIHAATAGAGVLLLAIAGPALHATLSGQGRTGAAAVAT